MLAQLTFAVTPRGLHRHPHLFKGGAEAQRGSATTRGHTASKWWVWDLNPGRLALGPTLFTTNDAEGSKALILGACTTESTGPPILEASLTHTVD